MFASTPAFGLPLRQTSWFMPNGSIQNLFKRNILTHKKKCLDLNLAILPKAGCLPKQFFKQLFLYYIQRVFNIFHRLKLC
jgi:hypothetical protein